MIKDHLAKSTFIVQLTEAVDSCIPTIVYWLQRNKLRINACQVVAIGGSWVSTGIMGEFVPHIKIRYYPTTLGAPRVISLNAEELFFNIDEASKALDDVIEETLNDASKKKPDDEVADYPLGNFDSYKQDGGVDSNG